MKYLYNNWYKSTLPLAVGALIFLLVFDVQSNWPLFLIGIQCVVYFLHQFEEYIYPGGFIRFFNNKPLQSTRDNYPLNEKASFWINIPIIFIAYPLSAILSGHYHISIGIWLAYFSIINALSHVAMFFKFGYNPGLIVSIFLNIPVGVYTVYYFHSHELVTFTEQAIGFGIGIIIQASIMYYGFKVLKPKVSNNN